MFRTTRYPGSSNAVVIMFSFTLTSIVPPFRPPRRYQLAESYLRIPRYPIIVHGWLRVCVTPGHSEFFLDYGFGCFCWPKSINCGEAFCVYCEERLIWLFFRPAVGAAAERGVLRLSVRKRWVRR